MHPGRALRRLWRRTFEKATASVRGGAGRGVVVHNGATRAAEHFLDDCAEAGPVTGRQEQRCAGGQGFLPAINTGGRDNGNAGIDGLQDADEGARIHIPTTMDDDGIELGGGGECHRLLGIPEFMDRGAGKLPVEFMGKPASSVRLVVNEEKLARREHGAEEGAG